jgi:hypothetical protein
MAAETIPVAYVKDFQAEIHRLAAQRASKLRGAVRVKTGVVGKSTTFNRLGASELAPMNVRHGDTTYLNAEHSTRLIKPTDKGGALLLDKQDEWKILIQPENDYAMNLAESANRFYDDLIIAALGGSSIAVDEADAETAVTLASWKSGTRSYGGGSAGTMAKVAQARRMLDEDEKMDGDFYAVVSPQMVEDLFMEVESGMAANRFSSRDYQDAMGLRNGTTPDGASIFGFKWIKSNRLPIDGSLDRSNYFFEKRSMGLAIWADIITRADELPMKNYAKQAWVAVSAGATRVEEAGVVEVKIRETASS